MSDNEFMRYWVYSRQQAEQQMKIHKVRNISNMYFKRIVINGVAKPFTSELKSMKDIVYSDSILVAKGDKRKMEILQ